ncbi:PTS glucitol/sorbitol transporter subunit IIA [Salinibacillus xinjiangensis]|uniref:PTS sorbitol transporter subunit IIA n=1 Tax=Salinibacillus xinjiangensis TaxID=1229268 RepID=A0A6G1X741_9BACI|nr:PTS glucitol/sorbitol transporter subunit IIA [Salinibacillus xinjiangensis]MRG86784.1 PTS sorbitol transporter subunit IIA [Salinibacillus xinjiangensis]
MAETVYSTVVTKLGESVNEFLEQGMLITFKDNAPAELAEFCILHSENNLRKDIQAGDVLTIGSEHSYQVTAVGEAVNKNLQSLGHITLRFDGATEPDLAGTLSLEAKDISAINIGDEIKIER